MSAERVETPVEKRELALELAFALAFAFVGLCPGDQERGPTRFVAMSQSP